MKLAFVTPRFGPGVLGGSEAVMAEAAAGFASRSHDVEVLTTCALDHYSWENELPEGVSGGNGLLVRRFPVDRRPGRAALAAQLSIQAGQVPDPDHQVSWLGFHFASPAMFEHLARRGMGYDAIVFSPYLFWTTTACLPLVASRAVVVPCLHDETYARLDVVRDVLAAPALVWFLSEPEHELAHSLGPVARRHSVTGAGIPVPRHYDPDGFRRRHGLDRPFVLFAGRREGGKGLPWALQAFASAVAGPAGRLELDLVLIGRGEPGAELAVPEALANRVIDLGYVDDAERDSAFAAALAYLQPSSAESFSRTAMEAWLAGRPVVALASNPVLAWHCRRSGGGLLFDDEASLAEALRKLVAEPALVSELGLAGRRYVLDNYTWPGVLDRMEASLEAALGPARDGSAATPGSEAAKPTGPEATGRGAPEHGASKVRRYLLAGSYPPVPGAASAATLAAARRAWAEGAEVVVASPRPSAAQHVLAGTRPLGRQLSALRRQEGCDAVVLAVEPGWPLPDQGGPRLLAGGRAAAGRQLMGALVGFALREVVVTGTPRELAGQLDALAPLLPAVHSVTASSEVLAAEVAARASVGPRRPAVSVVEPFAGAGPTLPAPLVAGPLEPGELLLATRARRLLGRLYRKALGRRAPVARAYAAKLLRQGLPGGPRTKM